MILVMSYGELPPEMRAALTERGFVERTEAVVEYHVHLLQARFNWQIDQLLKNFRPLSSLEAEFERIPHQSYEEYKAVLAGLQEPYFINDARPAWFLAEFAGLAGTEKVIIYDPEQRLMGLAQVVEEAKIPYLWASKPTAKGLAKFLDAPALGAAVVVALDEEEIATDVGE